MSENNEQTSDVARVEILKDGAVVAAAEVTADQINNGGIVGIGNVLPHTGAAHVDFKSMGTLILDPESQARMRATMTYHAHPHSIEGRLDAMEKRFERLLSILEIGEYNETVDGNWNQPQTFPTTGNKDYPAALGQELANFRKAMKEMREGPVYLRVYPDGAFQPEHWDV
jgi:hypothetical protein